MRCSQALVLLPRADYTLHSQSSTLATLSHEGLDFQTLFRVQLLEWLIFQLANALKDQQDSILPSVRSWKVLKIPTASYEIMSAMSRTSASFLYSHIGCVVLRSVDQETASISTDKQMTLRY